jgi:predicted MPP superfamily phosphohydrolase
MLKKLVKLLFTIFILIIAASLYLSNFSIETSRYDIISNELPVSFNGYRIAQLSDLHGRDLNDKIIKSLKKSKPHIIVITGDMMDDDKQWETISKLLMELTNLAPVYYVTGNHEWAECETETLLSKIEGCGVKTLRNEYVKLTVGAEIIILAGIDDPNGYADMKTPSQLKAEIDANEEATYSILLAHRPENFHKHAALGFDLVISGHVHGGLIRLPYVGGLFSPGMELLPTYSGGLYNEGQSTLALSRGLAGVGNFPRLFNRLDIPVLTLRSSS